jgi:predicted transcriptional regulator
VIPQYLAKMGRLKWKSSSEIDSELEVKLERESDVERHKIIVDHKIMNVLINNPNGIGTSELAKKVGIDRSNIPSYLNKLIKNGFATRGPGLHGKYYPTDKIFKNHLLSSQFMGEMFVSQLLGEQNLVLRDVPVSADNVDFRVFLPYLQREEFGLLRTIFEFVNTLGAYMTYVLIQAMNPENKYLQSTKYVKKDTVVQYWVKISIDAVIRNILSKFKDSIRMELNSLVGKDDDLFGPFIDYGTGLPQFQLKKKVIDELLQAYSRLYPRMFGELEKLGEKVPLYMELYMEHKEYLKLQEDYQRTCEHRYIEKVSRLIIEDDGRKFWTRYYEKGGKTIVHCVFCHHTTYKKFVTNSENKSYQSFLK